MISVNHKKGLVEKAMIYLFDRQTGEKVISACMRYVKGLN